MMNDREPGWFVVILVGARCIRIRVQSSAPKYADPKLVAFAYSENVYQLWSEFRHRYRVLRRANRTHCEFTMSPARAIEELRRLTPDLKVPPRTYPRRNT